MPTADANTLISRSSYINTWGTGWTNFRNDTIYDGSQELGYDETRKLTYFFAAPCIEVEAGIKHRLWLGNGVYLKLVIYKYNGVGFEEVYNKSILVEMTSSDWHYQRFGHNTSMSSDYSDNSDIHLWKVEVQWSTGGWPSRCAMQLYIRCAGIGKVPNNSTYNHMWRTNSKLHACECNYWSTSSFSSDLDFINQKKPEAYSGQPISGATGYMAYSKESGD